MDSRRAPAVPLLIKTVVITFPVVSERGLRGAAEQGAESASSQLPQRGAKSGTRWMRKGGPRGSSGLTRCVSVPVTVWPHTRQAPTDTGKS